jgi:hypothetical protein
MTRQQVVNAQQALDTAALNGIVFLAIALKKRGLLEPAEIERMHDMMSKPFGLPHNADNPAVQDAQNALSGLFAVLRERKQEPRP